MLFTKYNANKCLLKWGWRTSAGCTFRMFWGFYCYVSYFLFPLLAIISKVCALQTWIATCLVSILSTPMKIQTSELAYPCWRYFQVYWSNIKDPFPFTTCLLSMVSWDVIIYGRHRLEWLLATTLFTAWFPREEHRSSAFEAEFTALSLYCGCPQGSCRPAN